MISLDSFFLLLDDLFGEHGSNTLLPAKHFHQTGALQYSINSTINYKLTYYSH